MSNGRAAKGRPEPHGPPRLLVGQHAVEVVGRPLEGRCEAAREYGCDRHGKRLERRAPGAVEHQVDEQHREPDEHRAVQVAPERQQRDDEPHRPAGAARFGAEQAEEHREQREREQLHTHDAERRECPDDGDEHDGRDRPVPCSRGAGVARDDRERDRDRGELGGQQAARPRGEQAVEDELGECRDVRPRSARSGCVRNAVRDPPVADDCRAERAEPPRVGADHREERGEPDRQRDGPPGGRAEADGHADPTSPRHGVTCA